MRRKVMLTFPTDIDPDTFIALIASEDRARSFIEQRKWPDGPMCPHCGEGGAYTLSGRPESACPVRRGVYKCKACRKQFTVRTGTILERSRIPLTRWLLALHLMTQHQWGLSTIELSRRLDITVKSAWSMTRRIRKATQDQAPRDPAGTMNDGQQPLPMNRTGRRYERRLSLFAWSFGEAVDKILAIPVAQPTTEA